LDQQRGQLVRHAEHRVVAGVELEPLRLELLGSAALVRFAGGSSHDGTRSPSPPMAASRSSAAAPDATRGLKEIRAIIEPCGERAKIG